MEKFNPSFESLIKLENPFLDIQFFEKDHTYRINEELTKYSVTKLIHKYQKPFDTEKMSKIVARKESVPVESVIQKWDFSRDYANHKGTEFHLFVENFLARRRIAIDREAITSFFKKRPDFYYSDSIDKYYLELAKMIKNFYDFFEWYKKDHILIKSEFVVGDKKSNLAGTMDNLSYNKESGELVIFDYKTNKIINRKNKYGDRLLDHLDHLDDCEYNKYGIQIWLYKLIIERNTPYNVGNSYILWFSGDNYEKIEIPDFRKEATIILENEEKI